jgi:hypothetical protein
VSDLTTLATLERVIERAQARLLKESPWAVSGLWVLAALAAEIRAERIAKPPHVAGGRAGGADG